MLLHTLPASLAPFVNVTSSKEAEGPGLSAKPLNDKIGQVLPAIKVFSQFYGDNK